MKLDDSLGPGSRGSLGKAALRDGDFNLRRLDRQMFANYVELSGQAGSAGAFKSLRRSASVVETPTYDAPKLWRIELLFTSPQGSPALIVPSPWVPSAISPDFLRVTIRRSLDRDKSVATDVYEMNGVNITPDTIPHALPRRFVQGHQVGVKAEIVGANGGAPGGGAVIGVQGSIVEVTNQPAAWRNARMLRFQQSAGTQIFLEPNQERRQFYVQNLGNSPLYVAFDESAAAPGALAKFAVALPNYGDVYESLIDGWQGYVSGIWDAASVGDTDFAMVTEGT